MRVLVVTSLILFTLVRAALAGDGRVALVVGVASYQHAAALANTRNDASDVGAALQRLGFTVQTVLDPDRAAFERAVRQFGEAARGAEAAVFFYAGHALEVGGRNWLLPTSVELKAPRDLRFEAVDVESLLEQTEGTARVTLLFLDACRDNPFQKRLAISSRGIPRGGLGQISAGTGTLVAFATAPGTVAQDGRGRNSPFTAALLRHIEVPGLEVRQLLGLVRRDVREASNGAQLPWENAALEGEFYFKAPQEPPARVAEQAPRDATMEAELLFWQSIKDSRDPADFRAYLERYPAGVFAPLARNRLAQNPGTIAARRADAPRPEASTEPDKVQPASPPAPDPAAFGKDLGDRLASITRTVSSGVIARVASEYEKAVTPKALAAGPPNQIWYSSGRENQGAAANAALEMCQVASNQPCSLVAVNDRIEPRPSSGSWPLRDMPRVRYQGPFDPERIPGVSLGRRSGSEITSYHSASSPKAAAYHAWGGRVFVRSKAESQHEAEAQALSACRSDAAQKPTPPICFLYAVGDVVVLPRRLTDAHTPEVGRIEGVGAER